MERLRTSAIVVALLAWQLAGAALARNGETREEAKQTTFTGILRLSVGEGGAAQASLTLLDGTTYPIPVEEKTLAEAVWEKLIDEQAVMAELKGVVTTKHPGRGRPYKVFAAESYKILDRPEVTVTALVKTHRGEGGGPGRPVLHLGKTPLWVRDDANGRKLAEEADGKMTKVTGVVEFEKGRRLTYWFAVKSFELEPKDEPDR